jgi:hypothetical protein
LARPDARDSYPRSVHEGQGWKALELDELESRPWPATELAWHPLREALGTRIIGMSAFTAERAGQEVVERHRESDGGRGHEEVYVVLRGRASFQLDGEELDAPAGTFLLVSDPSLERRAVAAEPGTAVLALGGPPTFQPSASEWVERARPHLRSDPARARRILDELRAARPDSVGIRIGEALFAVAQGNLAVARDELAALLEEDPSLRVALAQDPDLAPLLEDPS